MRGAPRRATGSQGLRTLTRFAGPDAPSVLAASAAQHGSGLSFECTRCPECCRTVRVPVTHFDLARLRDVALLRGSSCLEWLAPEAIDMSGEPETFVETRRGRRLLVLRHQSGACCFLSAQGRCLVHGSRPSACAAYPFSLDNAALVRLPDSPCAAPLPSEPLAAMAAAARVDRELSAYVTLVSEWNRRQRRRRMLRKMPERAERFLEYLHRESGLVPADTGGC